MEEEEKKGQEKGRIEDEKMREGNCRTWKIKKKDKPERYEYENKRKKKKNNKNRRK